MSGERQMRLLTCIRCNKEFASKSCSERHILAEDVCEKCQSDQTFARDYGDRDHQTQPGRLDLV